MKNAKSKKWIEPKNKFGMQNGKMKNEKRIRPECKMIKLELEI
jgi:hypothetical protein